MRALGTRYGPAPKHAAFATTAGLDEEYAPRPGSTYSLTKTLEARGMTYEKFRQQIRDRFVIEQMRVKNVSAEVIISPNKVKTYYDAHRDEFKVEDEVKLRMIVTGKSADANAPQSGQNRLILDRLPLRHLLVSSDRGN